MLTAKPFSDLIHLIEKIEKETCSGLRASKLQENPEGSVEYGDNITASDVLDMIADLQGGGAPKLSQAHICVFASTYAHVEAVDQVTEFVRSAKAGDASVNKLCVPNGLGLRVFELAPEQPHSIDPAWEEMECMHAIAFGMEAVAAGGHVLGLAACAPGQQQQAAKLLNQLTSVTGAQEVLDLFRENAGREMAALMGAIIAAKSQKIPLVVEGPSALAAYTVLEMIKPDFCAHVLFSCKPMDLKELSKNNVAKKTLCSLPSGLDVGSDCALAIDMLMNIHGAKSSTSV